MLTIRSLVSAVVCGVVVATSAHAWAAPGDLDPTFGSGGIVTTNLGSTEEALALALQPDGKLIAAGTTLIGYYPPEIPPLPDIAVVRYNPDGSLDGSFGTGGVVTTAQGYYTYEDSRAVLVQADGKIVVGGSGTLVRYEADGTLDATFGSGGIVAGQSVTALVQQPDGKLVASGVADNGSNFDFRVARYNDDGSLDATFGSGGVVTTAIGSDYEVAFDLVLQPDGNVVATGYSENPDRDFALVRYESDGSLDGTFGTGGIVVAPDAAGYDTSSALVLQPDGKLVAGGVFEGKFALVRYNADGSLDPTFGSGGVAGKDFGSFAEVKGLVLQSNGKLIGAGHSGSPDAITLVAFNPDGSLDPTFGTGGVVTTTSAGGVDTNGLVIQPDKKLVVVGSTHGGGDFLLARYEGAGETIVIPPSPTPTFVPQCAEEPASGCRKPTRPEKSQLSIKDKPSYEKDALVWKWSSGAATAKSDFGMPTATTNYSLCVYDGHPIGYPILVVAAAIPSNTESGPCAGKPCWKETTSGFKYRDKDATPNGIVSVSLKEGADGFARIKVTGKGLNLPMPYIPLEQDPTVTVQLVSEAGVCWDADYSAPATINTQLEFKDRSD